MAVDQHWRLYYDPKFLTDLPVEQAAGVILHEVCHLLLKHHKRADSRLGQQPSDAKYDRWNIAADFAINDMLRSETVPLPEGVLYADQQGFDCGLSAERYYGLLEQPDEAELGHDPIQSDGDPEPTPSPTRRHFR